MCKIKDILSIALITYNRADQCAHILSKIFSKDSPIKECEITILNNSSTDNTLEVINKFCKNRVNVKVITNTINIGGNANIVRAFECSKKKYHWVLCDDDTIDWGPWEEIENALISDEFSMIFVTDRITIRPDKLTDGYYAFVAGFVPGVIYKSVHITSDIIQAMYAMTLYWYPQSVLSLNIMFNLKERFYFPDRSVVVHQFAKNIKNESDNVNEQERGRNFLHPEVERIYWHVGFPVVAQIINDIELRKKVILEARFDEDFNSDIYEYYKMIIKINRKYKNNNVRNLFDLYCIIGRYNRVKFIRALITIAIRKKI